MEKLLYGLGFMFKGVNDVWDGVANWILLGFNEVDPKEIFVQDGEYEIYGEPDPEEEDEH